MSSPAIVKTVSVYPVRVYLTTNILVITIIALFLLLAIQTANADTPQMGDNFTHNKLLSIANNVIATNHNTYQDGTEYWVAAPSYGDNTFMADLWLTMTQYPDYFTAEQVKEITQKFIDCKTDGNFPIYLNTNGNGVFYSGLDTQHYFPTGDGNLLVPQLERLYYDKSGDLTVFNSNAVYIKQALLNVPRDSNRLVYVPDDTPWVTWGFQDGVKKTGDDLFGSLFMWKADTDMAYLYAAAGDSVNATYFTNDANSIAANLSVLWDAADGMFYSASIKNKQIDIPGSSYAVYLGLTNASQNTSISSYLVNNYNTLTYHGYVRQSSTDWEADWGKIYDNGYWSYGIQWIATAMAKTSQPTAIQLITDLANSQNPTIEYYGAPYDGVNNNLASPMGALAYASNNNIFLNEMSFSYSATLPINDPSSTNKFQCLKNFSYSNFSGMASDWHDIYFTYSSTNATPIPFYIETQSNGQWANIWIALPASASQITVHWGNPSMKSQSSIYSTMDYAYLPTGSTIDNIGWDVSAGAGSITQTDGQLTLTTASDGQGYNNPYLVGRYDPAANNEIFEVKVKQTGGYPQSTSSGTDIDIAIQGTTSNGLATGIHTYQTTNNEIAMLHQGVAWGNTICPYSADTDYIISTGYDGSNLISLVNRASKTTWAQSSQTQHVNVRTYGDSASGITSSTYVVSWMIERKYASTPPTIGELSEPDIAFSISASKTTIQESDTTISLTVTKNNTSINTYNVTIATIDGTASSPGDFTGFSTLLSFAPNELTKTITLSIKDNNQGSFPKTFKVALSSPTGNATLGTPHEITITLTEGNLVHRSTNTKGITSTMNMIWLIPLVLIAMFVINAFMGDGIDSESIVKIGGILVGVIAIIVLSYSIIGNLVL